MSRKKTYVLDTSVYLTNAECIYAFENNDIHVPLKVFEEIDKHKKRQDAVGAQARKIIRIWDELRQGGSLDKGVRIRKGLGVVKSISASGLTPEDLPRDLDIKIPDHLIIATALKAQRESTRKVILVSRDINMRVIADAVGLISEDFQNNQVVDTSENIFDGCTTVLVDDQIIDRFYERQSVYLENKGLFSNQYVMLVSNANEKKTALGRFVSDAMPLRQLLTSKQKVWGIKPRNKEQQFLMDALMDPKIQIVTAIGKAGSGKTICAIAAGLEQTIDEMKQEYTRVIVSRPVQPLGKDIGFLPGTMEEKMSPWLMPIQDNLQFLMGNDKITLDIYMQIDNVYIDATSNGLTHAVEKFKKFELASHVTLMKGERSKVATFAAQNL